MVLNVFVENVSKAPAAVSGQPLLSTDISSKSADKFADGNELEAMTVSDFK